MRKPLFNYKPVDLWVRGVLVAAATVLAVAAE